MVIQGPSGHSGQSQRDSVSAQELDRLMREFPDWKQQFPDIVQELNPPRYHKSRRDPPVVTKSSPGKTARLPPTDYQATFRGHGSRPRSSKRPPPTARDPRPPPMTFKTNQRVDFVPKDLNCRMDPVKMDDQYERPTGLFDGKSSYQAEYNKHYDLSETARPQAVDHSRSRVIKPGAFDGHTTTREHYKHWVPQPTFTFGDLPSFTASILYPDNKRHLETTTQTTFRGQKGDRSTPFKLAEAQIAEEGAMDLQTTHGETYQGMGGNPAQKVRHEPQIASSSRTKFTGQTQSSKDYPGYHGRQPRPPAAMEPSEPTIQLRFNNRQSFHTEQRDRYRGVDARKHTIPRATKPEDKPYEAPQERFETMTNQKIDYQPIDLDSAYRPPVKVSPGKGHLRPSGEFDGVTMSKQFFQPWKVETHTRVGDRNEGHGYVPPAEPFQATSTTQDTFTGKTAPLTESYKPEVAVVDRDGSQDFRTMYRTCYNKPSLAKRLTRSQQAALLSELRQRKAVATGKPQPGLGKEQRAVVGKA